MKPKSSVLVLIALLVSVPLLAVESPRNGNGLGFKPDTEDPSYEPNPGARAQSSTAKTPDPKAKKDIAPDDSKTKKVKIDPPVESYIPPAQPAPQYKYIPPAAPTPAPITPPSVSVEPTRDGSGRIVKFIVDGKPVYEGEEFNLKLLDKTAPATATPSTPVQTPPNFQQQPVRNSYIPPAPPVASESYKTYEQPTSVPQSPPPPATFKSATMLEDLTADKPGTPAVAAQNELVLEAYETVGEVSSRAKKCYALLADLKNDIEATSRYLDNRGKENARLIHTSENMLETLNGLAALWPKDNAFLNLVAATKRSALLFNDELNQTPWQWVRVRWTYSSLLKDIRMLRPAAKEIADRDPKPYAVVSKNGQVTYKDSPDASIDPQVEAHDARLRAMQIELDRVKRLGAKPDESSKPLQWDLDAPKK